MPHTTYKISAKHDILTIYLKDILLFFILLFFVIKSIISGEIMLD